MALQSGTGVTFADAAAFQDWFTARLAVAKVNTKVTSNGDDPITVSFVSSDGDHTHFGFGFADNASDIDIYYRGFTQFDWSIKNPTDGDRKGGAGPVGAQAWGVDTNATYSYLVSSDGNTYFHMVLTPVAGDQKFLSFCRPDTVPSPKFSVLDTPITNGDTTIEVPVADQLNNWNVSLINPSSNQERLLTLVATDESGGYEQVAVTGILGTTLSLSGPVANDYATYRLGDFPISGFCHIGTVGSGLFDANHLDSIWMGPAGFEVTSATLGAVIRHPDIAANTTESVTGLNPAGRVAILVESGSKEVPAFSIPGLAVTAIGTTQDSLFTQRNRALFSEEWVIFSSDAVNSSRVAVFV